MLDRRSFLAIAGASALPALAAEKAPLFTAALVTDSHLGKPGADYVKRLADTVAEVNKAAPKAALFCGDLVNVGEDDASEKFYPVWTDTVKALKCDYRAVPGNHDPVERFKKYINKDTENVLDVGNVRFLTFADAEPNPDHMGVVTPEQLAWLKSQTADAKKKAMRVILIAHVTFHRNDAPDIGWYVKAGRAEFQAYLEANPHIIAMFAGHAHCGMRGWSDTGKGMHDVILPCVSYNIDRKLGTAPGFAINEHRPAWTLLEVFDEKLVLKIKPVGEAFSVTKELPLMRG